MSGKTFKLEDVRRWIWIVAGLLSAVGCGSSGGPSGTGICQSNRDCKSGESCVSGSCEAQNGPSTGCRSDQECPVAGQWCDPVDRQCKPRLTRGPALTPIDSDADASLPHTDGGPLPEGTGGDATSSVDPDAGTPDAADMGPSGSPHACSLDLDCASGICVQGSCTPGCNQPGGSCSGQQVCDPSSGRCAKGNLAQGSNCSLDAQCSFGICLPVTTGASSTRVCASLCGAASDCPLHSTCSNIDGTSFCLGESVFGVGSNFGVAAGGACTTGQINCQSTWCDTNAGKCIETCSREQDCGRFGGTCLAYSQTETGGGVSWAQICSAETGSRAGQSCTTNSTCQTGICNRYSGTCAAHCCSDQDCGVGQQCAIYDLDAANGALLKVCTVTPSNSGRAAYGAVCTSNPDCASQLCLGNPGDSNTPKACTSLCCKDSDCTGLPSGGKCKPFPGRIVNGSATTFGACVPK